MTMNTKTEPNDIIDLYDLWITLVKHKIIIVIMTMLSVTSSVVYILNSQPVYGGEVLIEIGDMILNNEENYRKTAIVSNIEDPRDLKEVLLQTLVSVDERKKNKLKIESPKESTKLIKVTYEDPNKEIIVQKLHESAEFIIKRHDAKGSFYADSGIKIRPSSVIGEIRVLTDPVKPQKILIVMIALIAGLMLGVFVALIKEFYANKSKRL